MLGAHDYPEQYYETARFCNDVRDNPRYRLHDITMNLGLLEAVHIGVISRRVGQLKTCRRYRSSDYEVMGGEIHRP